MSDLRVSNLRGRIAGSSPNLPDGAVVTGVATATSFKGSGDELTFTALSAGSGTFSGNVSVGGTLTYEDVTNQDVIGLSTFRAGIDVNAGGVNVDAGGVNVVAGISTIGAGASVTGAYKSNISAVSGTTIDCSQGNYFTKTITGATTFAFSNVFDTFPICLGSLAGIIF